MPPCGAVVAAHTLDVKLVYGKPPSRDPQRRDVPTIGTSRGFPASSWIRKAINEANSRVAATRPDLPQMHDLAAAVKAIATDGALSREEMVEQLCALADAALDVLLTLADHGFYHPKWSDRIHAEWTVKLISRLQASGVAVNPSAQIDAVQRTMDRAFPDALIRNVPPDSGAVLPVDPKDRHVVMAARSVRPSRGADAIA